jgi:peptidoglycan/LPS O-acetylase OafA/YrhL
LALGVLAAVTVASLGFSVWISLTNPDAAYFNTIARAWQFGIGGLLALLIGTRPPQADLIVRAAARVAGWATLGTAFVIFTGTLALPGVLSAVPVMAAAAIIWAGSAPSGPVENRLVSASPIQWLGGVSYSLYLWHWPLIVLWPLSSAQRWASRNASSFSSLPSRSLR